MPVESEEAVTESAAGDMPEDGKPNRASTVDSSDDEEEEDSDDPAHLPLPADERSKQTSIIYTYYTY